MMDDLIPPPPRRPLRRGTAAVEFAVVAPLFLLLLAGIIEFGQVFRIQHLLANASRRGARAAVVDGRTRTQIRGIVKAHCAQIMNISEDDVTVDFFDQRQRLRVSQHRRSWR